jgi:glycosyltransferase involved in cell wall biosynthesis
MSPGVLYLSYDGLSSRIGQSQVWPYLRGLARKGWQYDVVAFEDRERLIALGGKIATDLDPLSIRWHARRFRHNPPLLAKYIDQSDMKRTSARLAARCAYRAVHCRSYVAADAGLALKKRFNLPYIFDMRGFWVDSRREGGRWPESHPFYRYLYQVWKKKEATFISQSDHIVVLTETARREIESWRCYRNTPVSVIPCSLDYATFALATPSRRVEARTQLNVDASTTLLVYLGSLGTIYRLQELLQFYSALKRIRPKTKFLFIGDGNVDSILSVADKAGLGIVPDDIRSVTSEHKDVPHWLAACDLAVAFYSESFSSKGVSPTLVGEYLAVGLPVVCNAAIGDIADILPRLSAGRVVKDLSQPSISAAAENIDALLSLDRERIRERSRKLFDIETAIAAYDAIYRQIDERRAGTD